MLASGSRRVSTTAGSTRPRAVVRRTNGSGGRPRISGSVSITHPVGRAIAAKVRSGRTSEAVLVPVALGATRSGKFVVVISVHLVGSIDDRINRALGEGHSQTSIPDQTASDLAQHRSACQPPALIAVVAAQWDVRNSTLEARPTVDRTPSTSSTSTSRRSCCSCVRSRRLRVRRR
jgi:hypothetical protein